MIPHIPRLKFAVGAGTLLWLFIVTAPAEWDGQVLAAFAVLAVALECAASRLPDWGLVSSAPAVYLGVAMHPQTGIAGAAWIALASLGLRSLVRSRQGPHGALAEMLGDLLPVLVWLVALDTVSPWPGGWMLASAAYLILSAWFPPLLARNPDPLWTRARMSGLPFVAGSLLVGRSLAAPFEFQQGLPAVACLLLFSYAIGLATRVEEFEERKLLSRRLELQQRQRRTLEDELARLEKDQKQGQVLKNTLNALSRAGTTGEAFDCLLALVQKTVPCQSGAIFSLEGESLVARKRFGSSTDLEPAERLGRQAWREATPLARRQGQSAVAALPLPGYGVLTLSRDHEFAAEEIRRLWLMVRQAAVLVSKISEKESQQQALDFVSEERRLLSRWVFRLQRVLSGGRAIMAAGETDLLLDRARDSLAELIPHEVFWSYEVLSPDEVRGVDGSGPQLAVARSLVSAPGVPRREAGWPQAWGSAPEQVQSVLALALNTDPPRVVLLGERHSQAFNEEHLELFCVVCQQVETALNNLRLKREYADAAKMAAVGQIAAGLSHEINTPLCNIQVVLESAQRLVDKDPEAAKQRLERAAGSCSTIGSILQTLLYYATSYGTDEGEELELVALARQVAAEFDCSLRATGMELRLTGHRLDLEQMLRQLYKNAAAASKEPFEVELKAEGGTALVRVRDSGSGVPQEIADRIFEPFFTTHPPGQGLGLGLSVSRRIAEMHGGRVSLVPSARGGCFEVSLPLLRSPA